MAIFREFLERKIKQQLEKLIDFADYLETIKDFHVERHIHNDVANSYIYVKFPIKHDLFLKNKHFDLGFRLFIVGGNLVFRLQQKLKKPNGEKSSQQFGPSYTIENPDIIEKISRDLKGSHENSEEKAYDIIKQELPKKLREFMKKAMENIEDSIKRVRRQQPKWQDSAQAAEMQQGILRSLLNADYEGTFKM